MSNNVSLLDRAKFDLKLCLKTLEDFTDDELAKDTAAYHLAQAVEKALKFRINSFGIEYPFTHRFGILIEALEKTGDCVPQWLINNSDTLDEYATKTRYSDSYIASGRKILELAEYTGELIKMYEPVLAEE